MTPTAMKRIGIDARKLDDFGIGTYVGQLLEHFATADAPFRFVVFGSVERLRARFGAHFELVAATAGSYSMAEQLELPRLIRQRRLDLFHSPHYVVPVLARCPLIVTVHDLIHLRLDLRPGLKYRLAALYAHELIRRAVGQARAVVADSHATQRDIEARFPAARGKVAMIHCGVLPALGAPVDPARVAWFRERWALTRPLVLFVGNPLPHKNLGAVFDVLAELKRRGRPVHLALVGSKPEIVRARAHAHGVLDQVRALGYLPEDELPLVYRAADVLLFPTLYEGFGLPAVEAMAAGLPVVTSNISALPEVVGDAALTVNPRDISALAAAVVRVLEEPGLRERLVERGRERASQFSWRACAEAHLRLYERALQASRPTGPPER